MEWIDPMRNDLLRFQAPLLQRGEVTGLGPARRVLDLGRVRAPAIHESDRRQDDGCRDRGAQADERAKPPSYWLRLYAHHHDALRYGRQVRLPPAIAEAGLKISPVRLGPV